MKLYRVEKTSEDIKKEFFPKVPQNILDGAEDNITPRICVSSSIDGCLGSVPWGGRNVEYILKENDCILRVYEFDSNDINKNNIIGPDYLYENDLVRDAFIHDEFWIVNQNIKPSKTYDIKVDEIKVFWRETFSFQDYIKISKDESYIEFADVFMSYEVKCNYLIVK